MEYIDGKPLSRFVTQGGVSPKQAATVIRKLASALSEAHRRNILHRDVKPDNILVNRQGEPILTDFGLARETIRSTAAATQDGVILGSPAYMPPEQAAGNLSEMGPASDVYSLGVVLYELLTGEVPFRGTVVEVLASVLLKSPKPVRELNPGIDPALAAICHQMMAKKAADRYPTMAAVAQALGDWLRAERQQPADVKSPTGPPSSTGDDRPAESKLGAPHPERTPHQLQELGELVEQLLLRNDYPEAIHILEDIPDYQRTQKLRMLLGEALDLKKTVEKLERNLEKHINRLDLPALKKSVNALLKIHPSHPRGKEIKKALNTGGRKAVVQILKDEGRYDVVGNVWEPKLLAGGITAIVALAIVAYFAVTIYIKGALQEVAIEIDDPTATVKIDGQDVLIAGQQTGRMKLTLGEHHYTVEKDGIIVKNPQTFAVTKDGQNKLVILLNEPSKAGNRVARTTSEPIRIEPDQTPNSTQPVADVPPLAVAPFDANQAKAHQETWAKHLRVPVEYINSIGVKFRLIPPGEYLMGSAPGEPNLRSDESPQHKVRITKPFYFGVTEVTAQQWVGVMGSQPWSQRQYLPESEDAAANYVNWNDAVAFCHKLKSREKTSQDYRLPTEAEWEMACRAGTSSLFYFGDSSDGLEQHAWTGNLGYPHRVAQKRPNAYGLLDITGNVWEWCSDYYEPGYYKTSAIEDPPGPIQGVRRVNRGACWASETATCRCGRRSHNNPAEADHSVGFRLVLSTNLVKTQK